jgi:hypothetical protein
MANGNKITAHFGADVSEVEAKMLQATRATKRYEQAVKGLSSSSAGSGLANNLGKTNSLFGEITKKFTGGKILESVLGGVGLGGGFAIAEKAAALISKHWEDAAKSAEAIAKSSDEATDYVLKRIGLRETEDQALAKARQRSARADTALRNGSDDPEKRAELVKDAEKAAYELEVLEKKAREKKSQADKKLADEAEDRRQRDLQLFIDANERVKQDEERVADARKKAEEEVAKAKEKAAEEQKKRDKQEQERYQEIEQMEYDRIWRRATNEQKVAQVIKEGREAQARYDKDASSENLLALEKVRKKYLDLMDEVNGKKGDGGTAGTGGDGSRTRGGVLVSAEDAARSDATMARNERLNRDSMGGRIRSARQVGSMEKGNKTDELLQQIRDSLKPKAIKKA